MDGSLGCLVVVGRPVALSHWRTVGSHLNPPLSRLVRLNKATSPPRRTGNGGFAPIGDRHLEIAQIMPPVAIDQIRQLLDYLVTWMAGVAMAGLRPRLGGG